MTSTPTPTITLSPAQTSISDVILYPNPSRTGRIAARFRAQGVVSECNVSVYTVNYRKIAEGEKIAVFGNETILDLDRLSGKVLSNGTYILKIIVPQAGYSTVRTAIIIR